MDMSCGKSICVVLLSYNSRSTISRALHSIFSQDYPHIEIIVADDASEDFDYEFVRGIFERDADSNIERYAILTSDENRGTVRNLRNALAEMASDYFTVFGADDVLNDAGSLTAYMRAFAIRDWEPLLVSGLVEMRDENLVEVQRVLPNMAGRSVLGREDPELLFQSLASECIVLIVATCFARAFIDRVGAFDDSYVYYEDYPTFLRMARKGVAPAFINRVMLQHAAGGIANGSTSGELTKQLYRDRQRMWQVEYDPYASGMPQKVKSAHADRIAMEKSVYLQDSGSDSADGKTALSAASALRRFAGERSFHRAMQALNLFIAFSVSCTALCAAFGMAHPLTIVLACCLACASIAVVWFSAVVLVKGARKLMRR